MSMPQRYVQAAMRLQQLSNRVLQMPVTFTAFRHVRSSAQCFSSQYLVSIRPPCRNFTSRTSVLCSDSESWKDTRHQEKDETSVDFFGVEEYEQGKLQWASERDDSGTMKRNTQVAMIPKSGQTWKKKAVGRSEASKNDDTIVQTSFGLVRLDGQRRSEKSKRQGTGLKTKQTYNNPVSSHGSDYIDDQYFGYEGNHQKVPAVGHFDVDDGLKVSPAVTDNQERSSFDRVSETHANIFDEQYFDMQSKQDKGGDNRNDLEESESGAQQFKSQFSSVEVEDLNEFDKQMLGAQGSTDTESKPAIYSVTEDMEKQLSRKERSGEMKHLRSNVRRSDDVEYEFHEPVTKRRQRVRETVPPNTEDPQTAYDMAMKIRQELKNTVLGERPVGDVDSKGFRILKNQVPDFSHTPADIMVRILRDSVIYNDNEIVAIDKPYGIASQGGQGVHHSIAALLPKLAKKIDPSLETLHNVHRLDKDTTGVMVFAKTREMQLKLIQMFRDHEVIKKYWVITKGVPNPPSGIIEIPMAESTVNGVYRMTVKPDYDEQTKLVMKKSRVETLKAVTKYKVLDSTRDAALVLCEPKTGVKHQIRCHLSFGLNVPILGDHKYSYFTRLAPQRLFPAMLERLGIRQSKVRHVPMHLHAKSIIIPNILEGRYLHLSTKLPGHFVRNMKYLKLRPPK